MMRFTFVAATFFLIAAANATVLRGSLKGTAADCSSSSASLKFTDIVLNPTTPAKGKNVELKGTGDISSVVNGGSFSLAVSLNGNQLYGHTGKICGETDVELPLGFGKAILKGLDCPTTSGGTQTIDCNVLLPTLVPSGAYEVKMTGKDASGNEVYCIVASFPL